MKQTTKQQVQTIEREQKTLRLDHIEAKPGEMLTSLEEATLRMHHGISIKPEGVLATNALSEGLREELLEMELRAFVETRRVDELPDLPSDVMKKKLSPRAQKIVAKITQ
ncbi:MAG: hypothetical protein CMH56_14670 [Myxococcales bacterium]|nr:hypothetical protein [Myxococcales bacterium]|tara:strand:+ start:138 stop:467 length:330 start_codon:yes stop_codon:yes gene_type:complete